MQCVHTGDIKHSAQAFPSSLTWSRRQTAGSPTSRAGKRRDRSWRTGFPGTWRRTARRTTRSWIVWSSPGCTDAGRGEAETWSGIKQRHRSGKLYWNSRRKAERKSWTYLHQIEQRRSAQSQRIDGLIRGQGQKYSAQQDISCKEKQMKWSPRVFSVAFIWSCSGGELSWSKNMERL